MLPRISPLAAAATAVLILGIAPARWLGWLPDLAAVAWIPLNPLAHAVAAGRDWLRPAVDASADPRNAAELLRERDEYRGLAARLRLENERLEERLRLLEGFAEPPDRASFRRISAVVLSVADGRGTLRLNRGSRHGIAAGDVVLLPGDRLIGRVAAPVGRLTCEVVPAFADGGGRLRARVESEAGPGVPVLLEPDGRGGWRSEADGGAGLTGRRVRLDDPSWPAAAQGLLLGEVGRQRALVDKPLRTAIEVSPSWSAGDLAVVAIRLAKDDPASEGLR
jgi:hypothetical protein